MEMRLRPRVRTALMAMDVQMRGLSRGHHSGEADVIKQETKDAIAEKTLDYRHELLRFIYSTMTASEFADAFWDRVNSEWTGDAASIADAFEADLPELDDSEPLIEEPDASRLHDAICEGRRQDAIDILNDVTGGQYRSVREQANLFPDRVPA